MKLAAEIRIAATETTIGTASKPHPFQSRSQIERSGNASALTTYASLTHTNPR